MRCSTDAATARLACWHRYLSQQRQRRLLVWPGLADCAALTAVWQVFPAPHIWVGERPPASLPEHVRFLTFKQARTQLGREVGALVIDGRDAFEADAFGAVAGALNGGGIAVWLTATDSDRPSHRFEQWCQRVLSDDPDVVYVPSGGMAELPLPPSPLTVTLPPDSLSHCEDVWLSSEVWRTVQQQAATLDQQRALVMLCGALQRALSVLTAARGRGKSAALGLAAAAWLQEGGVGTLWLTAPRAAAVDTLFEHIQRACPESRRDGNSVHCGAQALHFIAPDALTQQLDEASPPALLLVDEAAALPLPFLQRWVAVCPHVVLSTTLHGYEGSAQGFVHYLEHVKQSLDDARENGYSHYAMAAPIRWADGDPFERVTARMLCLNAAPYADIPSGELQIKVLNQAALLADEALLHQVFGLLVSAHYRTSPSDLQTLLDHPALSLWVAVVEHHHTGNSDNVDHVVAVVMAFDEGGLSAELAHAVAEGRRRPAGHLLPQTLALHTGCADIACQHWRRVTRIAVHPHYQRQGIGSRLLAHVHRCSQREGIDLLGASFGGKPTTLAFWQRNGFATVRVGLKDDTVTGERAVMVARECQPQATEHLAQINAQFWATFKVQLAFELSSLPPRLLSAVLRDAPRAQPPANKAEQDATYRFGLGHAPLASVRPMLQQALLRYADTLPADEVAVLAGVLLQGRSDAWAKQQLPALVGKRALDQWLRAKVALWSRYSAC